MIMSSSSCNNSSRNHHHHLLQDDDGTTPLLGPHLILTVDSSPPPDLDESTDQLYSPHLHLSEANLHPGFQNPFGFLNSGDFSIPESTTLDPFKNHTQRIEGLYEWIKIVICLPIVVVRLVLFGCCLLVGYLATKLALVGWKDKSRPLPKWRSRIMWVTRFCSRLILFSFGYHWIKRKGRPAPRETAPIIVSNHISYIEPIFFFYELFPTIVASESHDSIPFVGTIIRAMQVIYVNRFSQSSRKHAVAEIKRKATCDRFPRVLLFPEGTTTNGRSVISFQLGAFIPGYPIQPVVVRYPHVHFDQSWGDISLPKLMFRMFTQFCNFLEVEYLPVISPKQNEKEPALQFAERVSRAMATALNVVQTGHSYGDLLLLTRASESKQENPRNFLVEMAQVEALFHISTLEALEFLNNFLSMNPDSSGHVRFGGFLSAQNLKACWITEKMFEFIDIENNGYITFKQFLCGSAHVLKLPLFHQACEEAFSECDIRGNNYVTEQELRESIKLAVPNLDESQGKRRMSVSKISRLFSVFDSDKDGKTSKDDFMTCLRKNPLQIALFSPSLLEKGLCGD